MAPKKPIYDKPMTPAERQARTREARRARGERLIWVTANEYQHIAYTRALAKKQAAQRKREEVLIPEWLEGLDSRRLQEAIIKEGFTLNDMLAMYDNGDDFLHIPNVGRRGNGEILEWLKAKKEEAGQ